MTKKIKQTLCTLLGAIMLMLVVSGCDNSGANQTEDFTMFSSYREIPGVTDAEVEAIETLKEKYPYFYYGMLPSTEAFVKSNGEIGGFSVLVCDILTELFDIRFEPKILPTLNVFDAIHSGEIDFTGDISITEERRQTYIATDPIALRTLTMIRHIDAPPLETIAQTRKPRYAFRRGSVSIEDFASVNEPDTYETVLIDSVGITYPMLRNGEVDALIALNTAQAAFREFDDIIIEDFFPPIFSPVSLTAVNPELEPIISVVQKALENGADSYLNEMYKQGYRDYTVHDLFLRFDEDEIAFLEANSTIPLAAEYDNYPISFYSTRYGKWQGISIDILNEVGALTGLEFEVVHEQELEWSELLGMLENGEAYIITDLIQTPEREGQFLWTDINFLTDHSALISKADFPEIGINDILSLKVGVTKDTAHVDLFHTWFPDHKNVVEYDSNDALLQALVNGEIDVIISKSNLMLQLTHYHERPGYKIAFLFDNDIESAFGFNKEQEVLRSIVNKTLKAADAENITNQWLRRTYDYRSQLAEAQRPWILGGAAVLILIVITLAIIYIKDKKKRRIIAEQASTLAAIYDSIPAMVFTKDLNNKYTSFNSKFTEEAQVSQENLVGKDFKDIDVHDKDAEDEFEEANQKVIKGNVTVRSEGWYNYVDGSRRAKEIIRTPLVQNGNVVGLLGIAMDITERKLAEEELYEARERTKVMLDTLPICCCLINKNYECIDCNNEATKLFELGSKQEFLERFMELSPKYQPDGRDSFKAAFDIIDRAFAGERFVGKWTHQLPDGTPIQAITTYERVKYGDDYIVVSYAQDIREQVRMTSRLEAIMNNLPGMVFQQIYNPPHYTYTFVSMGCKELIGYTSEELTSNGVKFFDMVHPDDIAPIEKLSAETIPFGLPFEATFRIKTRDGEEKWIWERSRVIEQNSDGTPYLVEGYYTDVTERRQLEVAEHEKRRMSSRIDAIMDNLPGMAYQCLGTFPDYPLTFVSEGSRELLGYAPEEIVDCANKYMAMLHPDDIEQIEEKVSKTLNIGLPFENTHRLIMADGTLKWVLESCRVIEKNPDGTPNLIEGYVFDITQQRKVETAELANRAKSDFLATMSHEIRTPMNSIMGFAELALDSGYMPQIKDYLEKIADSASWLLNIINDILDISKIEAGKIELEYVPFDMRDIFSRCQSVILPNAKEKGLDLRVYAEPIIGKKLLGDPVRLYQVLMNLLSNAVKFTETGTVRFSSVIKKTDNGNTTVYFEVKDSGIGMTPEQIQRIFEPFIQADSSTTRNYGGTGLGLAITKNIVELMGGELALESTLGIGSNFNFEIVFDTVESTDEISTREDYALIEKPYFNGLILICDDNPLNLEVVCEHLSRVGLRTVVAENGKIGVEIVQKRMENNEKPFDLIFMDMFMPVMDGVEAASKIIALNTGTPIVAMTANIMASELERYRKHGMPNCLGKPFTSQELWRVLLKYLNPLSVGSGAESDSEFEQGDEELQRKLRINFVKNNQTIHSEIAQAVALGDIKLAYRLAHTLKGSAGLIGKKGLKNAAAEVEALLKDGAVSIWDSKMNILETELTSVLEELKPLLDENASKEQAAREEIVTLNNMQALALFEKLEPLLKKLSPECVQLLGEIRAVKGAERLVRSIEDYDFLSAAGELETLKSKLEENDET